MDFFSRSVQVRFSAKLFLSTSLFLVGAFSVSAQTISGGGYTLSGGPVPITGSVPSGGTYSVTGSNFPISGSMSGGTYSMQSNDRPATGTTPSTSGGGSSGTRVATSPRASTTPFIINDLLVYSDAKTPSSFTTSIPSYAVISYKKRFATRYAQEVLPGPRTGHTFLFSPQEKGEYLFFLTVYAIDGRIIVSPKYSIAFDAQVSVVVPTPLGQTNERAEDPIVFNPSVDQTPSALYPQSAPSINVPEIQTVQTEKHFDPNAPTEEVRDIKELAEDTDVPVPLPQSRNPRGWIALYVFFCLLFLRYGVFKNKK